MLNFAAYLGPLVWRNPSSHLENMGVYITKTANNDQSCLNPLANGAPITIGYVNTFAQPIKEWMEAAVMKLWSGGEGSPPAMSG